MNQTTTIIDEILHALANDPSVMTKDEFHKIKNNTLAKYKIAEGPSHIEMIERYEELVSLGEIGDEMRIRKVLRKRAVRSLSGVSVISLLTKFWGCPGKCVYCPTYEGLPKSYISDEPAVQRAEMNEFDAFRQIQNRLQSLKMTGNAISKCDVRIIGGTWSVYPREYQEQFIRDIYDAHTVFSEKLKTKNEKGETRTDPFTVSRQDADTQIFQHSASLDEAKERNETAESRVIGMAIETRPDWITPEEIIRLRSYGVTRVEIGYQTTHDHINDLNKRGHGNKESIAATKMLKDAGFKVVVHMMPGLLGATPELDRSSMAEIWSNPDYRPDEIKIYPMVVTPNSELTEIWERGEFTPYTDDILIPLMAELQGMIPEYVRLNRMYRDIPAHEILAGSKLANLRQVTEVAMRARGITRHDISAREIRARANDPRGAILDVTMYEASGGHEYFIQMIDPADRTLFGVCRLRIPSHIFSLEPHFIPSLDGAAIIRELHVFGDQIPVSGVSNPLEKGGKGGLVIDPEKGLTEQKKKKSHIPFRKDLTEKAKELRNNMTGPEKNIWYKILSRDAFEGLRFLRQKPLLDYIVDFYCPALRLVIEIDGESHIGNEVYDLQRTTNLSEYGIQIVRFTNDEVLSHLEGVYELLRVKILEIQKSNPPELPQIQAILPPFSSGYDTIPGQHMGMGKKMLAKCEEIVREKYTTVKKMAVISGVGARGYYRDRGYELQDEYMIKYID